MKSQFTLLLCLLIVSSAYSQQSVPSAETLQLLGDPGIDGAVYMWNDTTNRLEWGVAGSALILDLGDDGSNESTELAEFATMNDPLGIFSEPSDNKVRFDGSKVYSPGGTNVAIADGGTNADTAAGARQSLDILEGRLAINLIPGVVTHTVGASQTFYVTAEYNGWNVANVLAYVPTAGTTGSLTVTVVNSRTGDMLASGPLTVASGANTGTIATNASADDLVTGDVITVTTTAIHTTPGGGLQLYFDLDSP